MGKTEISSVSPRWGSLVDDGAGPLTALASRVNAPPVLPQTPTRATLPGMAIDPKIFHGTCDPLEWAAMLDAVSLDIDPAELTRDLLADPEPAPPRRWANGELVRPDKRTGRQRPSGWHRQRERTEHASYLHFMKLRDTGQL
jgi:hypothetical protein